MHVRYADAPTRVCTIGNPLWYLYTRVTFRYTYIICILFRYCESTTVANLRCCIMMHKLFISRKNKNRGLHVTCSLWLHSYDLCNSCAYTWQLYRASRMTLTQRFVHYARSERIKWENVAQLYIGLPLGVLNFVRLTFRRMHAWPNLAPRVHWNMKRARAWVQSHG